MDSIITIKNDMKDARYGEHERWEQGISITSEDRDIIVLGYNKAPEVVLPLSLFLVSVAYNVYRLERCLRRKRSNR